MAERHSSKLKDLTGQVFGKWQVLHRHIGTRPTKWVCRCECGTHRSVFATHLIRHNTSSCGCRKTHNDNTVRVKGYELIGKKFGHLLVLKRLGTSKKYQRTWSCKCDCGNETISTSSKLVSGRHTSCGCRRWRKMKHGKTGTKVYNTWCGIKDRCLNVRCQGYARYGGRGIRICDRWMQFENFYEDMGDPPTQKHSIDRINNDGNYEPSNCRWALDRDQSRNRSKCKVVELDGETMLLTDAVEKLRSRAKFLYGEQQA